MHINKHNKQGNAKGFCWFKKTKHVSCIIYLCVISTDLVYFCHTLMNTQKHTYTEHSPLIYEARETVWLLLSQDLIRANTHHIRTWKMVHHEVFWQLKCIIHFLEWHRSLHYNRVDPVWNWRIEFEKTNTNYIFTLFSFCFYHETYQTVSLMRAPHLKLNHE